MLLLVCVNMPGLDTGRLSRALHGGMEITDVALSFSAGEASPRAAKEL